MHGPARIPLYRRGGRGVNTCRVPPAGVGSLWFRACGLHSGMTAAVRGILLQSSAPPKARTMAEILGGGKQVAGGVQQS